MIAEHGHTFQVADYILFVLMLATSLGIGLYTGLKGTKSNTTSDYLMANRELGLLPVTLSITGEKEQPYEKCNRVINII